MTIRVIIADDHPLFLKGLRATLADASFVQVVGEAHTGEEAVALVETAEPDVVVMDMQMPGIGGAEATRRIVGSAPRVGVLILTMFDDDLSVFAAMRAGARGYVLKGAAEDEVLSAIASVARGEAIFGSPLARRLIDWFTHGPRPAVPFAELTTREREVLELVAQGLANDAIAERMGISPKTVRNLVSSVLVRLQVADRSAAIVRAREAGLGRGRGTPG